MKKILIFSLALALGFFPSCSEYLDTEPAGGRVSDEQLQELVKENPDLVLGPMMLGATAYMHNGSNLSRTDDKGFKVWMLGLDMFQNDMVLMDLNNWFKEDYVFSDIRTQTSQRAGQHWRCFYQIVYKANQILDLITDDAGGKALIYKAQALTYRALGYYYLMNIYQDDYMHGGKDKAGVPLYLAVGSAQGRAPSTEVYSTIIADLKTAVTLFEDAGYDPKADATDIDQSVANLVLARAALSAGEYSTAASAAAAVIAEYNLMDEATYTGGDFQDIDNPETIWGYKWVASTSLQNDSYASFMSIFATGYGGSANKSYVAIDQRLFDQIEGTDYRKKNFLADATTIGEVTYPKYANTKFGSADYYQDEVFMRVSEAYLLKAEAEARGGNANAAQQSLYDLVSKRDSGYSKSTKTGDALLDEIFLQSRIELWGEGFEFFLNKRFNKGVNRTGSVNHAAPLTIAVGKDFTFQIPLTLELSNNPYITEADQNPL